MKILITLITIIAFSVGPLSAKEGFVHRHNTKIVDGQNQEIYLKGVGLGGWLVPEGYMLNTPGGWGPTLINNGLVDLVGEEKAKNFWKEYTKNYVAAADIQRIASWGYNSIRLPFHYNRFVINGENIDSSGYKIVDDLIDWCEANGIYIILDMHCAPGGQSDSPSISDSDGTARLWLEKKYRDQAVEIWQQIARRYAGENIIAGYDVINEPVLPSGVSGADMRTFYVRLTDSIRAVDQNHLLFFEGNWYATDFSGLTPIWDGNMAFSFHQYWSATDFATIQNHYNMSLAHNVPLWLGETGENSNTWFYEITQLMQTWDIGICWWTHKKFEKITSPLSANLPAGYNILQSYWDGNGAKPDPGYAEAILLQMADNLKIDKCEYRPGLIPSQFDPDYGNVAKPVKNLSIPGYVRAVDYDLGVQDVAYHDNDYIRTHWDVFVPHNSGYMYRNDGVDIEKSTDQSSFGSYNVGFIEDGEWIKYTVDVKTAGKYTVKCIVASQQTGGAFRLVLDGTQGLTGFLNVPNTGGWQNWQGVAQDNVDIPAGKHTITFQVVTGGFNIKGFDFIGQGYTNVEDTKESGENIRLYPNPSNGRLNLQLTSNQPTDVSITIYNTLGQRVWTKKENVNTKENLFTWDIIDNPAKRLASGLYFYRIQTKNTVKKGKLILLRP